MNQNDFNIIVDKLELLSQDYKNLAKKITENNSPAYKIDIIALSVVNRAISINDAFRVLVKADNIFASLHLVRIQIDTLVRYFSIIIAQDPNYIDYVLSGDPINKFKDLNKEVFTDKYLVKHLENHLKGITDLYTKYCNYIHYGREHIEKIKFPSKNPDAKFSIEVGNFNKYTLEEQKSIILDMITISIGIYDIINDWISTKNSIA